MSDSDADKFGRVAQAMPQMKKFDIRALHQAYEQQDESNLYNQPWF